MTPDGVMQPTNTTQDGCISAANFQACVNSHFSELRSNLSVWLDDFALLHTSEADFLPVLKMSLRMAAEHWLVILFSKSAFYAHRTREYTRLIDAPGETMDYSKYESIKIHVSRRWSLSLSITCTQLLGWSQPSPILQNVWLFRTNCWKMHGKRRKLNKEGYCETESGIVKLGWSSYYSLPNDYGTHV